MRKLFISACLMVALFSFNAYAQTEATKILEMEGVIGLVGNEPFVRITFIDAQTSKTYELVGYWKDELRRLGGIKVKIRAVKPEHSGLLPAGKSNTAQLPVLEVLEYEIVDVGGGQKPFVGYVHMSGDKLMLHVRDLPKPLKLSVSGKLKQKFESLVGAKVWIVGKSRSATTVKPMRFGVIAPPKGGTNKQKGGKQ